MILTVGEIDKVRITLSPYQFNGSLTPTDSYNDTGNASINVTAVNNMTSTSKFTLYYQINSIDDELKDEYFKYTILRKTSSSGTYSSYASRVSPVCV